MNTHHDAAIESGEVRAERNGKGTRYVLQVAKQDIDAKEVDRWRKLAAIPEARDAIDRAMQRKPGDWDTHPEPEVTVDNINDNIRPTGTSKDAALRRLRKAGLLLAAMEKNKGMVLSGSRRSPDVTSETLSDLGIGKMQSHRWQAVAGRYSFTTWEEYVGERWDWTPQRSGQMIIAAEAVTKLETIVSHLPSRESHVRELLKLEATAQPPRHAMHPRRLRSHTMHRSRYRAAQEPRAWGWVNCPAFSLRTI